MSGLVGAPQYLDVSHLPLHARLLAYLDSPWVTDSIMVAGINLATDDGAYEDAVGVYGTDAGSWSCACKGRLYKSACRHLVAGALRVLGVEGGDL